VLIIYGSQSSPIFLHNEFSFGNSKQFFAYADAGVNIPWRTTNFPKQTNNNMPYYTLKVKPYGNIGFGLHRPINNSNLALRFFVGYSIMQFGYTEHNSWNLISSFMPPNTTSTVNYLFTYRTLSLNMGVAF
jgi:hypothetical protein